MRYLMGIDSGGTKTLGVLEALAPDGSVQRWQARVGNTNHHSCGPGLARRRISRLIADLCRSAQIEPAQLAGLGFAGAGVDSLADWQWVAQVLGEIGVGGHRLICSDALAALAGANGALTGGILLAGTGSIAVGVARDGALVRVGGWGYKLDDAGSGYGIAILGLRAAFEALDGRGRATAIGPTVLHELGLPDMQALLDTLYAPACSPDRIALLAACICSLDGSDPVAEEILDAAAAALARMATTLVTLLDQEQVSLGLCGGMLENAPPLRERLLQRLASDPRIRAHPPRHAPVEGALILLRDCEEDALWAMPRST